MNYDVFAQGPLHISHETAVARTYSACVVNVFCTLEIKRSESLSLVFFKSGVLRKGRFTHVLQSFEERKTTKKKAGYGTICPKSPAQARKCLVKSPEGGQLKEGWLKIPLHVVLQLSATLTPSGVMAYHFTRRRRSMQPPQPLKRGKCLKLLQEHNRRDGSKTSNPPNVPQLRPVERFFGQPDTSSVCWQLESIKR